MELHHRRLERMYHGAPCNAHYRPRLTVGEGRAEVVIAVRPELFHAAGALHGSVCFKVLDDSAFFAANSLVEDVFVLTAGFNLHLLRPVTEGEVRGAARIVHAGRTMMVAEAVATDSEGREVARGTGTFVRGRTRLDAGIGYA